MPTDRGFTLLEVMVAFIILALAAATLYQGGAGGVAASAASVKYLEALSLARSHLAEIGRGAAIAEQEQTFTEGDGFTYRIRIRPAGRRHLTLSDNDRADNVQAATAILFDIEVTESWKTGLGTREIKLATRLFDVRTAAGG